MPIAVLILLLFPSFAPASPADCMKPSPRYGIWHESDCTAGEKHFNHTGFRGHDHPLEKPHGALRVMVSGFAAGGSGLKDRELLSEVAEPLLTQALKRDVEVINAATSLFAAPRQTDLLRIMIERFKPDVVFYMQFNNLSFLDYAEEQHVVRLVNGNIERTETPSTVLPPRGLTWMWPSAETQARAWKTWRIFSSLRQLHHASRSERAEEESFMAPAIRDLVLARRQLDHGKLYVLMSPNPMQTRYALASSVWSRLLEPFIPELDIPPERVSEQFQKAGLETISLPEPFAQAWENSLIMHAPPFSLSESGARAVAEAIKNVLLKRKDELERL